MMGHALLTLTAWIALTSGSAFAAEVAVPYEAYSYYALATEPTLQPGGDDDAGLAFCHSDKWSATCLTALMIYRCGQYAFPFTPYGCALASADFVDRLEMKRIDVLVDDLKYSLPVIFTRKLERLIKDHGTQAMLASLRALLVASEKSRTPFNLWAWTKAISMGSTDRANETLAILLQDTSGIVIQVEYLRQRAKTTHFDQATLKAIDDLEEICFQLNYDVLVETDGASRLRLYPPIKKIESEATPLIYHFYPMAYLARMLQQAGHGDRLASFLPFLFNTEYLNQTLQPEAWPLHHPDPFKINSDEIRWKMRDLYGGYAGARFGIKKTKTLPVLGPFQSQYSSAPYSTMRAHFWFMPISN